ncbi:MAG: hypothetical protein ACRC1P_07925 [Cellulosilyticaceae bacterium]
MARDKQGIHDEIEFYAKEYQVDQDHTNDSIDMTPQMVPVSRPNTNAWTSFILGIISSLGWIFPIIGLPITIVGTVLGAVGMKNKRNKGIAIAGFVINLVFLSCTVAKGIVDIVFYCKRRDI